MRRWFAMVFPLALVILAVPALAQQEGRLAIGAVWGPMVPLGAVQYSSTRGTAADLFMIGSVARNAALRLDVGLMGFGFHDSVFDAERGLGSSSHTTEEISDIRVSSFTLGIMGLPESKHWVAPYGFARVGLTRVSGQGPRKDSGTGFMMSPGVGARLGSSRLAPTLETSARLIAPGGLLYFAIQFGVTFK